MKLTLEKPVYGGDCLARAEGSQGKPGKAVFVPLTLPGETVTAHVTEEKRSFAKAEVEEILAASPDRVAPACPHFGACGGCSYQHAGYEAQLGIKQQILRETLTRAGVAIPAATGVLAGKPWEYRNRIRVALEGDGKDTGGKFGYRGRRSHAIVPIQECPIAAPSLILIAERTVEWIARSKAPVAVSELEIFTNRDETQALVTLLCDQAAGKGSYGWLDEMHTALPENVTGIRLQTSDGSPQPNVIAGSGAMSLRYDVAGHSYRVDHGAFFQVNRWLVDEFAERITAGRTGKLAWDLFAGVGLFARRLARAFEEVLAVESAGASYAALEENLAGASGRAIGVTTLDFLRRNRQEREARPELIVLDPPRAGLGEETTSLLNAIHAPEMVYASCDPATLARDLHALTQERYRIESATLVDMFPQTFHLETVVVLRRS